MTLGANEVGTLLEPGESHVIRATLQGHHQFEDAQRRAQLQAESVHHILAGEQQQGGAIDVLVSEHV